MQRIVFSGDAWKMVTGACPGNRDFSMACRHERQPQSVSLS